MGEKIILPYTKASSAEERLEELVKNNSLVKCVFVSGSGFYADIDDSEFRKYPDGFEVIAISTPKTVTTKGLLYWETKNICFLYKLDSERKKQDIQRGE